MRTYLQKDTSRVLYLGLGLFAGQMERKERKRYIAGPLFICAVDLEGEADSNTMTYDIRWNSITLNYDLITMILEQEDRDEEDNGLPFIENQIAPEKLKILSEIEDEIEIEIEEPKYQKHLLK